MVGRVQVAYQGRQEQPQAVAPEMMQPVRARFDPNADVGAQLAKSLGVLPTEQLGHQVDAIAAAKASEDRRAAETYANSVTVEELGKRIKDGSMLPSQSPTFVAALQHIYGENTQQGFERDTLSKIQTGELKFGSPQEMEKYITDHRNEALSGADPYTTAGYDKGFAGMREKVLNANTQVVNAQTVERGIQEASDNLGNLYAQTKDPAFKGDRVGALLDRYALLRKTSLLRDDAAKEALTGLAAQIATDGNQDTLNDFLNRKLDNGVTVRAVMGDTKAIGLEQHAEAINDKNQMQRIDVEIRPFAEKARSGDLDVQKFQDWTKANEKWVKTPTIEAIINGNTAAQDRAQRALDKARVAAAAEQSVAAANQAVAAAVATGKAGFLPDMTVMTPEGGTKKFDTDKAAQASIADQVARNKMSVEDASHLYSVNNVENPQWTSAIQTGLSNISSVGRSTDGKSVGQLNDNGKASLELFMRLDKVEPRLAEKAAGGSTNYQTLSDIRALMETGYSSVDDAAAVVNQANHSNITEGDYSKLKAAVSSEVGKVMNPGWFAGTKAWVNGLFGNSEANLTSMEALIRRRSEILVRSGAFNDAASAVKASVEYLTKVTSKVNNDVYLSKDLPAVPQGEDPSEWFGRFIKEVPQKIASDQKLSGDVRLSKTEDGNYVAWIGGTILHDGTGKAVTYQQRDIGSWVSNTLKSDHDFNNQFRDFKNRADREGRQSLAPVSNGVSDTMPARVKAIEDTLFTPEGFRKVLRDGNQKKSLKELYQIYDPYKGK